MPLIHLQYLILPALCFALISCEDDVARTRVQKLETDIEGLRSGMKYLLQESFTKQSAVVTPKRAVLDPTGKGYAFVETSAGQLLISCDGATQYLDGHKLTLWVGNPFNMKFNGFKLTVRFGARPPRYEAPESQAESSPNHFALWEADYATWEKSLKQQEISFTESLQPGAWTTIDLVLSPSKPEDVGYIDLQMLIDQVSLQKPSH